MMQLQRIFYRFVSSAGSFRNVVPVTSRRSINSLFKIITTGRWSRETLVLTPFTTMGIFGFITRKEDDKDFKVTSQEILLAKADALFDQSEYKQIYELLNHYRDSGNVEFLWRLCRALYNMSKTASEVEAKKMIYEGYDLAVAALAIDENHHAVHKWMAIFLDAKSGHEGMKARITQLATVKNHMLRASELNPKDATTLHMLGSWCYQISDLAWYQRKIAAAVFGEPPKSSFEEALSYFEAAEKMSPNFYSHNLLMLGKTHLKLNRREEAVKFLKMASEYEARNDDDHEAKKQALKLLNDFGFKTP
ncbi:regulator of microtubule dynamics protein 1-like [Diprion similis]|uniref:regulator of microtubule dynamics protein 1-like n=1 Tax=Diprion similis TaxID=362088 RepID=UPI001EF8E6A7|nr:regulator of microtubule dynamics protein 1-like [Diprion similis]